MNSFETDIKRAFCSINFLAGLLIECIILWRAGSDLFQISVPVLASLPYSTAWLGDYQSGYIKEYLPRCGRTSYILGKFLACGISGGSLITTACLFRLMTGDGEDMEWKLLLIFLNHRGQTLSRSQILEGIWDEAGDFVNDNTLTVAMKRLREKLHHEPCITTVRGIGYRMEETE